MFSAFVHFSHRVGAELVTPVGFEENQIVGELVNSTSIKKYWIGKYRYRR